MQEAMEGMMRRRVEEQSGQTVYSLGLTPVTPVLTLEQIQDRYPDEWVCTEVIKENEDAQPTAGRVIAHSPEKTEVIEAASKFRTQNPQCRGFLFFTGELIPKGMVIVCQTPAE